ncbi:T9SS type A sorting domain-containing protein [Urechidicola croceus]|uniref:PKD domain-containing protein n=1 Tax=Urechidicola croceus TaxID=1850246 RepID=A0A1D8P543_9FLAO|nr:T9SS type A sorting domain-containing protein [Urechidicola croceus]AOW19684.1 hypothetical protein LPB138_02855 [Urechidicola croceus]
MIKKLHIFITVFITTIVMNAQNTIEVDCQELFLSGTNLAWNQFSGDVGFSTNPDLAYFDTFFSDVKAAGGNSVRWWFHTDAAFTPQIETSGNVTGLHHSLTNAEIIGQVEDILDTAWDNGIHVNISLFSFDMLKDPTYKTWSNLDFDGNLAFLQSPANVQSYIDNGLTEMVTALKDHPALLSWEIFNEPEGMSTEFGWTNADDDGDGIFGAEIPMSDIQMVVNKVAGAIHDADPDALVTNGSWAFRANTDVGSNYNYYTDARLIAEGGASNGTLDYYQVHYYDWQNSSISPFAHPASYWELDKPVMVGEFHGDEAFDIFGDHSAYDWLYDNGYFGAWGWQYTESDLWADVEPQIEYMQTQNPTVVNLDPNACLSAEFSADDTSVCITDTVTFTASSSSTDITTWSWDFGDSQTATTAGPHEITYSSPGTYTVSLTTSDGVNGDTVTKTDYITVVGETVASISITSDSSCETSVTFEGSITPDIPGITYRWRINNGAPTSTTSTFTPTSINDGDSVHFEVSNGSLGECHNFTLVSEAIVLDCGSLSVDDYLFDTVSIFPNPATDRIEIKGLQEEAVFKVYSILGKKLLEQKLTNDYIDISSLKSGIYFVKLITENGQTTKKLVKK